MWFIFILTLLNALLNNDTFVNTYRVEIGGFPANIFDILLAVGLVLAVLPSAARRQLPTRTPRALIVVLTLLMIGIVIGATLGMANNLSSRQYVTELRNFLALPLGIIIGYRLAGRNAGIKYIWIMIISGFAIAVCLIFFFDARSSSLESNQALTNIRLVKYVSYYAGLACAILFFAITDGIRLMPKILMVFVAAVCFVGQCTPLSRSEWLALAGALLVIPWLLPKRRRFRGAMMGLLTISCIGAAAVVAIKTVSVTTGRDFAAKMEERLVTMMPWNEDGMTAHKAWDSRAPGTVRELIFWSSSPILGQGLSYQDRMTLEYREEAVAGFRHNSWVSTLLELGLPGFFGMLILEGSMLVVGWRMVHERFDRETLLMGAFGVTAAVFTTIVGYATMSFNTLRWGLPLSITFGVLMQVRARQLAMQKQWEGYLEETNVLQDVDASGQAFHDFGMPATSGNPLG